MSVTINVNARLAALTAAGTSVWLRDHGLPAERVRLEGDPAKALDGLCQRIERVGA